MYTQASSLPGTLTMSRAGLTAGVWIVAAAKLLVQLLAIRGYGWFRDEFYYIACSERLAFGYVDHPPLTPLLTAATRALVGDSIVGMRLLPALAGAATVVVAGLLAREFGARRFGQTVAAVGVLVAPQYLALNHIVSMNAYEVLAWPLAALILCRLLNQERAGQTPRLAAWVWFGVVLGLGLQNKHSMLFFGFGVAVGFLLTPARRLLLTRGPWVAALVALAIFLPNLVWQIQHGWPTLEFMQNAAATKNVAMPPATFLGEQVLSMNPAAAPLWVGGLIWLLAAPAARSYRLFGIGYVAILAVFLSTSAKPYYLAPYYPILLAGGGVAVEALLRGIENRTGAAVVRAAILTVPIAAGIAIAPLALPVLPVEDYIRYAHTLGLGPAPAERHRMGVLPQFYADMFGWHELVATIEQATAQLTPEERDKVVVFTGNYGEAGAINFLGRGRAVTRAISGHNNYWLWGPNGASREVLFVLGGTAEQHDECTSVHEVARSQCDYCMPYEDDLPVFLCRDLKLPVADLWSAARHYN